MLDCRDCGKSFGHHDWCPTRVKAVVMDRGEADKFVPRYRVSVDRLKDALDQAPTRKEVANTRKRPKKFQDVGKEYNSSLRGEQLVEYPFSPDLPLFEYANQTNRPKRDIEMGLIDPGYGRIMATEDKRFRGYSTHPPGDRKRLDRSPEIRQGRWPGREMLVEYPKGSYGQGLITQRGRSGTIYRDSSGSK